MPSLKKKYNTKLTPYEESEYKTWRKSESARLGKDLSKDEHDYDVRGMWSEAGMSNYKIKPGHGTDKYKKPNHPTFSVESKYSTKKNPGGIWLGNSYLAPKGLKGKQKDKLKDYMSKREPGIKLEFQ